MTTTEIVEAYLAGAVKLETFVFSDGMPTWVTLLEVPEIAAALADADEEGSLPSELTVQRTPTSTPPPRKAAARVEPIDGASNEPPGARDDDADSGEPQPFALVSGRANGMSKHSPGVANADASVESPAAPPWRAPGAGLESGPGTQLPSATYAGVDVPRDDGMGHFPSGHDPAPATMPFAAAQEANRSSNWIWVIVVIVVLGAAAAFVAPRFGFKLL